VCRKANGQRDCQALEPERRLRNANALEDFNQREAERARKSVEVPVQVSHQGGRKVTVANNAIKVVSRINKDKWDNEE